jgi:ribosome-binding factor A
MPKEFSRAQRVAQQIHRELSDLVRSGLKDPRAGFITLTEVELTSDLEHARVFFTVLGEGRPEDNLLVLRRASGFLRGQLARRMKLRMVPELHFAHDTSVERGIALSRLIDQAVAEDAERKTD